MGAQSLVLGKQFGEGFQYGKRKISAMSNEEFNKLSPAKLAQDNAEELKQMIPSMKGAITDMRSFQSFIVKELIETVKQLPGDIFGGLTGDLQTSTSFSKVGTTNTAYAGSLGLPAGALAGLVPGTKQFEDTAKLLLKEAQDALNIVQNRKKGTGSSTTVLRIQPTPYQTNKKVTTAIAKTPDGVVKQIASLFQQIKFQLQSLRFLNQSRRNQPRNTQQNATISKIFALSKTYNQLVQRNRMPGLSIDSAKSIQQTQIVKK